MSSPYQCPRHNVALVARVLVIYNKRFPFCGPNGDGKKRIRYFACPVDGCDFKKPDKWAKRRRYGTND